MDGQTDGQMDGWIDIRIDSWTDGRKGGWMDRQMDRQTDKASSYSRFSLMDLSALSLTTMAKKRIIQYYHGPKKRAVSK